MSSFLGKCISNCWIRVALLSLNGDDENEHFMAWLPDWYSTIIDIHVTLLPEPNDYMIHKSQLSIPIVDVRSQQHPFAVTDIHVTLLPESNSFTTGQNNNSIRAFTGCISPVDNTDLLSSYSDVVTIPRGHDDKDKDEEPSAGSNRGTKRRRSGKEAESSKEPTHKESRTTSSSKRPSRSQPTKLEDPSHQEFNTGDDDVTLPRETQDERQWHPSNSPTPDREWHHTKTVTEQPPQPWITQLAQATGTVAELEYHLEEVFKATNDQLDWNKPEGRPYPHDLRKPLHLIPNGRGKLTNLSLDERYVLNVALRMYTRRIVIQERVEDLQLAVESYQKKINLTKPDLYCSDLRKMTPYTAYPDIQGIIYQDEMDINCLMRTDELYKFSDGTLTHVRTALNDIATRIQMEYLPKRQWTKQDK
ncbi:hypothetical protein Tco_0211099 [Tanacetum coccineum]